MLNIHSTKTHTLYDLFFPPQYFKQILVNQMLTQMYAVLYCHLFAMALKIHFALLFPAEFSRVPLVA